MSSLQARGMRGEALALAYLRERGYQLVARNVRMHQRGEIDLIMRAGEALACVEVKTRVSPQVPFELLVPRAKQQKIIFVARWYMQQHRLHDVVVRFDVVFVDLSKAEVEIRHIPGAFTP